MTCAQGLLRLLWGGGGARSWSATGLARAIVRFSDNDIIILCNLLIARKHSLCIVHCEVT